jgi:hypothetical protein
VLKRYAQRIRATFGAAGTGAWWAEVAEASFRQGLQVVTPLLLIVATSGSITADAGKATAVTAGTAVVLVVLRRLAGLTAPDGAGWETQLVIRAVSAFAGAGAGVTASEGFDLLSAPWTGVLFAASSSALLALAHGWADPPATMAAELGLDAPLLGDDITPSGVPRG